MNDKITIKRGMEFAVFSIALTLILSLLTTAAGGDICMSLTQLGGHVYDTQGNPMPGVKVTAYAGNLIPGNYTTSSNGVYFLNLNNLSSGPNTLIVNVTNMTTGAIIYSETITISCGEDIEFNFPGGFIPPIAECNDITTVTGFVNGTAGNPMAGVNVTAYLGDIISASYITNSSTTNSSNLYQLNLINIFTGINVITITVTNITSNETIYSSVTAVSCGDSLQFNFPRPNLTLTASDITFIPQSPTEGIGTVTINATIRKSGNINGTADVLFYDGSVFIGHYTINLSSGQSGQATLQWSPKSSGTHTITVVPGSWSNAVSKTIDVKSIYNATPKLVYDTPGNKVIYVKIPKYDNVTFAEINLTGSAYLVDSPVNGIDGWKSSTIPINGNHCNSDPGSPYHDTYCFGYDENNNTVWSTFIFNSSYLINLTKLNTRKGNYSDYGSSPPYAYNLTICETNITNATNATTANCTGSIFVIVNNGGHYTRGAGSDSQTMNNPSLIYPGKKYLMIWKPTDTRKPYAISRIIDNFSGAVVYPENITVNVSNNTLWSQSGVLNVTKTINDSYNLTWKLNSQLPSCSCSGCINLETDCAIPLTIHSDTQGVIDVSMDIKSIPKGARIAIEPQYTNVLLNNTFMINVTITGKDVYAADFELAFDPGFIEAVNVSEGDFFSRQGATAISLLGGNASLLMNVNNTEGRITVGNSIIGNTTGITGSGVLASIWFKAKAQGISNLQFENYNISNSSNSGIENVTAVGGVVEVSGEVNPPTNLTINLLSNGSISLKWNASNSTSVNNYKIYFSNTPDGFNFTASNATTSDTNWTDNTAPLAQQRYYIVRAASASNEDNNTYVVGKFDIKLYKKSGSTGVNWVSIPLNTSITTAQEMADDIGDTFETATRLDAASQTTQGLVKTPFGFSGTNFAVVMGEGYSISVSANTTWTVTGTVPENVSVITLIKKSGSTGVNWIGLHITVSMINAQDVANDIGDTFETATRLDATVQTTQGLVKTPFGFSGTNFAVVIGEGYSISVSANTTWVQG